MTEDQIWWMFVQNWIIIALLLWLAVITGLSAVRTDWWVEARNAQHKKLEDIESEIRSINSNLRRKL